MRRLALCALVAVAVAVAGYGALQEGRVCGTLDSGRAACSKALAAGEKPSAAFRKGLRADADKAGHGWLFGGKR